MGNSPAREKRSFDSHEHTLFHSYVEKGTTKQRCDVCRKEIYGLVYACETCKFSRHRWCAERRMPSEITHPSHSMHKLKLQDESSDFLCERCFHNSRGPRYHCYSCDIDVDLACASSTKDQLTREDQGLIPAGRARNRIKHFSHGEPLALFKYRKTTKYYELDCSWCDKRLSGMSYGCFKSGPYGCRFFLHESCMSKIPTRLQHPFHRQHYLYVQYYNPFYQFSCNACNCPLLLSLTAYYACHECNFYLHISCARLLPTLNHKCHKHSLTYFSRSTEKRFNCNACGGDCDSKKSKEGGFYRCVQCNFNIHFRCLPISPIAKHRYHRHFLILHDGIIEDDIREYYCDICEEERNPKHHIYYCKKCTYIGHVECVVKEVSDSEVRKMMDLTKRVQLSDGKIPKLKETAGNYMDKNQLFEMQEVHLLLKDLQQEEKEKKKEKKELREKDEDEESSSDDEEDEETDDIDDEWTSEEEEDGDKEEMNEEEEEDEEKEGKDEQKMEEEERLEENEESSDEEKEEEDDKLKETSEEEKKEFKHKEEKYEEKDEEKEGENEEHMEEEEGLEENEESSDEEKEEEDDKLKEMSEEEKKEFKNKEEKHEVEDEEKEGKNEEHMEEDEEGELEENEESSDEEDDESENGNEETNEKNEANQGKASTSINGTKKMSPHPLKPSKTPALEIEHFSHWHPLSLFHLTKKYEYENCKACRQELNGTVYICKTCEFPLFYYGLHKACAELPYELIHPFHSLHYLTLLPQFPYSESRCFLCDECGEFSGGFVYLCMDCQFKIDVKCAMLVASKVGCQKPKHREKETELLHFSHQHMLVLGNLGNKSAACCGCNLPILGLAYCCLDCLHFIHESCLRTLPQEIQHPFHPLHPLVAFHDPNDRKCHACKLEFRLGDFIRYGCWQCKLDLHLVCANSLRRVLKSSSHKHNLYYFGIDNQMFLDRFREPHEFSFLCSTCSEMCNGPFYRCVKCSVNFHLKCVPVPHTIKSTCHIHPFILKDSFVEDDSGEYYCDICEEKRHSKDHIYYCEECQGHVVAHIECVLPMVEESSSVIRAIPNLESEFEKSSIQVES